MPSMLSASARLLAIGGVWVAIGLLIIPAALFHALSGASLTALEALKAKADELRRPPA